MSEHESYLIKEFCEQEKNDVFFDPLRLAQKVYHQLTETFLTQDGYVKQEMSEMLCFHHLRFSQGFSKIHKNAATRSLLEGGIRVTAESMYCRDDSGAQIELMRDGLNLRLVKNIWLTPQSDCSWWSYLFFNAKVRFMHAVLGEETLVCRITQDLIKDIVLQEKVIRKALSIKMKPMMAAAYEKYQLEGHLQSVKIREDSSKISTVHRI